MVPSHEVSLGQIENEGTFVFAHRFRAAHFVPLAPRLGDPLHLVTGLAWVFGHKSPLIQHRRFDPRVSTVNLVRERTYSFQNPIPKSHENLVEKAIWLSYQPRQP